MDREALQVKNERFCQLFQTSKQRDDLVKICVLIIMSHTLPCCALIGKCVLIRLNTVVLQILRPDHTMALASGMQQVWTVRNIQAQNEGSNMTTTSHTALSHCYSQMHSAHFYMSQLM